MKLVFFIGAGFSAPFNMPTMNEFKEAAFNSMKLDTDEVDLIEELSLDARKANSFLNTSPTNIEDILTFAIVGERLNLSQDGSLSDKLSKIIFKIYSEIHDMMKYNELLNQFRAFLNYDQIKSEHSIEIITTNYDLNIELSILKLRNFTKLPFEYEKNIDDKYEKIDELYYEDGIPIYKLHGSINWFYNNSEKIFVDDRIIELREDIVNPETSKTTSLKYLMPAIYDKEYKNEKLPYIIAPTFLKPQFRKELNQIWSNAANALQNADVLIFIGYSFPQTDTEMKYFIARSLYNNARIKKIKKIDVNATHIVSRLQSDISGYGNHFQSLLEPNGNNWMNTALYF